MSLNSTEAKVQQFFQAYIKFKNGTVAQTSEVITVTYPDQITPQDYTTLPSLAREKKIPLIASGSPAFQQILKECLENGVLCQVTLNPKESLETLVKRYFRDEPSSCRDCCHMIPLDEEAVGICSKEKPCHHQINNGKIASIRATKKEPVRYFQFYYSVAFQNKLRPKSEETIVVMVDEDSNVVSTQDFSEDCFLRDAAIELQDSKTKLNPADFDRFKTAAEEKLNGILSDKLVLFDLPLSKEKKLKLRSFEKRLRKERREQVISRKHDFDYTKWQTSYETLLSREEESYTTNIAVKFINLLVMNTAKIKAELTLDNGAIIHSAFVLGMAPDYEVTCPLCKGTFTEGYATQDGFYVCKDCTRQSVDTAKIYSKKAPLRLDEKLNEYIEPDAGFVCAVCGKRHSRLLEFKCSHDNSSVCIYHYGTCDVCGKVFSKLNLSYTDEFKRQLCPKHAANGKKEP